MKDENKNTEHTPDEKETLRQENESLKAEMRRREAREEMTAQFTAAGAISPALLFDLAGDRIEFDSENKPLNTADLVAAFKKEFPEQFENRSKTDPIDAGSGVQDKAAFLTAEALAKMTPAEIQQLDWADVRQVLSN